MKPHRTRAEGFTLIELMIVVVIIGILAAVAVPAMIRFVKRSKTSEATGNLGEIYNGAQTWYSQEHVGRGVNTTDSFVHCTVGPMNTMTALDGIKHRITTILPGTPFFRLGFQPSGQVYYQYSIEGSTEACALPPNNLQVYTFVAIGDLDGNGTQSRFEMAVASDAENSLYHAPGIYVDPDLELE